MITIIDAIMGAGKTTLMHQLMNKTHLDQLSLGFKGVEVDIKFLVVVPTLSEVERYQTACPDLDLRDPQPIEGRKLYHLSTLVEQGHNICTTHALFKMLTVDIYRLLKERNYVLIVDEVLDCLSLFTGLNEKDREHLFETNSIYVEPDTFKVRWNHKKLPNYNGRFSDIKNLCDNGNLILYRNKIILWELPTDFFRCFKSVYILTYLFLGSPMSNYLRAEGLSFVMKGIRSGELVDWYTCSDEKEIKQKIRSLVIVYHGPLNTIGDPTKPRENPFSVGWCERQKPETMTRIKLNTEAWFRREAKTPAKDNLWTCFKPFRNKLSGDRYAKAWIANNTRATNDYRHKVSVAYLCNVFHPPFIKDFFEEKGITVYENVHALSDMIQFIWRSQIRDDKPISVYIPSFRMRHLFELWLHTHDTVDLLKLDHDAAEAA